MLGIIRKDLIYTAGYMMMLPAMLLYFFATRSALDTNAVFMMTGYIYLVVLGSILITESNEMKNRGYAFLAAIPVTAGEIAAGKLLPIFLQVLLYSSIVHFSFEGFDVSPYWLVMAKKWLLLNALVAMVLSSFIYWLVFRLGFEKAVWLHGALLGIGILSPIAVNETLVRGHIDENFILFRIAEAMNPLLVLAAGAVIFYLAWHFSARELGGEVRLS
jgi:hypothetical protein